MAAQITGWLYCENDFRTCTGPRCVAKRASIAAMKAFKASLPPAEYDWADLEQASDLARQHRYPDGRPWRK